VPKLIQLTLSGLVFGVFASVSSLTFAGPPSLRGLDAAALSIRQDVDLNTTQIYRTGLERVVGFAQSLPELFPEQKIAQRLLTDAQKQQVRGVWKSILDYQIALEAIERFHSNFHALETTAARNRSLHAAYAAHTARYRFTLDFIERAENDPELSKVLNEPVKELGLRRGAYDRLKLETLNVGKGGKFAALSTLYKNGTQPQQTSVTQSIAADTERIWQMGRGRGVLLTINNAHDVVRNIGQRAVFPVQAGISEWMGDTKVKRPQHALISEAQIAAMTATMQPGDIMLQRREWYVSNVGLPGFWSHAALYIGTSAERDAYFDDAEVRSWLIVQGIASGRFDTLLEQRHPRAHAQSIAAQREHDVAHLPRVLEAISEGVSFTTMNHSAAADSVVALRPRLSKLEKAAAILRAYGYAGRPYDFDFDFQTDTSLVCTELIYKAYEPSKERKGITMQPQLIVGRLAVPANDIARDFDRDYNTPMQQWDMVAFLDGSEKQGAARTADVAEFRRSWQRPKWHILLTEKQVK
jgi:hypothetical protein